MTYRGENPSQTDRAARPRCLGRKPDERLGRSEAERLLTRELSETDHDRLAELLAAAAGPPRPEEVTGYQAARDVFDQAGADVGRVGARSGGLRPWTESFTRVAAIKIAGVAVALSLTGAVAAAEAGVLPASVQRTAHSLFGGVGVPAPPDVKDDNSKTTPNPGLPTPTGGAAPSTDSVSTRTSIAASTGTATGRIDPGINGLCNALVHSGTHNNGEALGVTDRKKLALAAGGEQNIDAYCGQLLAAAAQSTTATSVPTPTGSGKTHPTPPVDPSHTPGGGVGNGHTHASTPKPTR